MKKYRMLLLILISFTGLRLLLCKIPNLYYDEAYWWLRAKHLSFGYYEHPPLTAWIVWLFTSLGKDTEFFIRAGFVIFFTFSTIIMYLLGKEVSGSKKVGFYSALLLNIIPLFSIEGMLAIPDSLQTFFYLGTLLFFVKAIKKKNIIWWAMGGVFLGLGLLVMYSVILLVPILFIFLFASRKHNIWLHKKEPYFVLVIACLIFAPNLIWNILHEGGAFVSVYQRVFANVIREPSAKALLPFIYFESILISPIFFINFLFMIPLSGYIAIKKRQDYLWLLFLSSAPVIFILFVQILLGRRADPDWIAPGIIAPIIITTSLFSKMYTKFPKYKKFFLTAATTACMVSLVFTVLLTLALIRPLFFEVPLVESIINDFYGWPELSDRIMKIKESEADKNFFLFSDYYSISSELAFYTKNKFVYLLGSNLLYGGKSFDLWGSFPLDKNAIFVTYEPIRKETVSYIKKIFATVTEDKPLVIYKKNKPLKVFHIYRCYTKFSD